MLWIYLHFVNFQLAFIISFLPRCTGKCNCSPKWPFSGLQYQWTLVGTSQVFGNCQNIRHQSEFFEQRSLYIQKLKITFTETAWLLKIINFINHRWMIINKGLENSSHHCLDLDFMIFYTIFYMLNFTYIYTFFHVINKWHMSFNKNYNTLFNKSCSWNIIL